jgi:hypothetical protein
VFKHLVQLALFHQRAPASAVNSGPCWRRPCVIDPERPLLVGIHHTSPTPMVAYCATKLQGAKCVDSRCQYSHDIVHCKPCGRSFPASLLPLHQNNEQHLRSVASNGHPKTSTPRSLSQSPLPAPSSSTSRPSGGNTPTIDEGPRVTVSDEGGLVFVAEGMETADGPSFSSISHTILIEKTNVLSSLAVQSMKLTPSPNPWCE